MKNYYSFTLDFDRTTPFGTIINAQGGPILGDCKDIDRYLLSFFIRVKSFDNVLLVNTAYKGEDDRTGDTVKGIDDFTVAAATEVFPKLLTSLKAYVIDALKKFGLNTDNVDIIFSIKN